ncbi:MAG: hypothetical protein ACO3SO_08615 [Luteolibacter sp.]
MATPEALKNTLELAWTRHALDALGALRQVTLDLFARVRSDHRAA